MTMGLGISQNIYFTNQAVMNREDQIIDNIKKTWASGGSIAEIVRYVIVKERFVGIHANSLIRKAFGLPISAGGLVSAWCIHGNDAKLERDMSRYMPPR